MGKVAYGFTSSIDGFIAGPGHDMDWMNAAGPLAEGTTQRTAERVAGIISGRRDYDAATAQRDERDELTAEAYGGAWSGTEFVLTHRPEDLEDDPSVIALNCDVREAIKRANRDCGRPPSRVRFVSPESKFVANPGRRARTTCTGRIDTTMHESLRASAVRPPVSSKLYIRKSCAEPRRAGSGERTLLSRGHS